MTPQEELKVLEDRKIRVRDIAIDRLSKQIVKMFGEGAPLSMEEVKDALLSRQKEDRAKTIKEALSHLTPEDITLALGTLFVPAAPPPAKPAEVVDPAPGERPPLPQPFKKKGSKRW